MGGVWTCITDKNGKIKILRSDKVSKRNKNKHKQQMQLDLLDHFESIVGHFENRIGGLEDEILKREGNDAFALKIEENQIRIQELDDMILAVKLYVKRKILKDNT